MSDRNKSPNEAYYPPKKTLTPADIEAVRAQIAAQSQRANYGKG